MTQIPLTVYTMRTNDYDNDPTVTVHLDKEDCIRHLLEAYGGRNDVRWDGDETDIEPIAEHLDVSVQVEPHFFPDAHVVLYGDLTTGITRIEGIHHTAEEARGDTDEVPWLAIPIKGKREFL